MSLQCQKNAMSERKREREEPDGQCEICMEDFGNDRMAVLPFQCTHSICSSCHASIVGAGNPRCPFCRAKVIGAPQSPIRQRPPVRAAALGLGQVPPRRAENREETFRRQDQQHFLEGVVDVPRDAFRAQWYVCNYSAFIANFLKLCQTPSYSLGSFLAYFGLSESDGDILKHVIAEQDARDPVLLADWSERMRERIRHPPAAGERLALLLMGQQMFLDLRKEADGWLRKMIGISRHLAARPN